MPKSRIPSPARSQGVVSTPRRHKSRGSRSVCSPAPSNASGRLTSVIDQFKKMDSFVLSPMATRRSVLTDTTDIEEPRRKSWWKNLNENSQDVMEVLDDNKAAPDTNNVVEDIVDIEVFSQEEKHISLDLPESSDNESIHSIVLSQRKLFTQKENKQKKFGQLVGNRETLAKLHKTNNTLHEKTVTAGTKTLFQGTKRSKPAFPLLNISPNKTTADKTKENVATEPKVPVRNIFGNRPANKRKNIFADFIVSESEDEIPEIQPRVFGFQKKVEHHKVSIISKGRDPSPTSSITTDMELDEWRHLPSSTLVENQLDEMITHTPVKRARLSKISDGKESEVGSTTNNNTDKTAQSNKSVSSKSRTSPRIKDASITNNASVNKTKPSDKSVSTITRTSPRTRNTNEMQEDKNNEESINESISSKSRTSLRTKDANRSKRQDQTREGNVFKNKAETTIVENEVIDSQKLHVDNQKMIDRKDNVEDKTAVEDEAQNAANTTKQSNKSTLTKTRTSPRLKDSSISNETSVNKSKQADKSVTAITRTSLRTKNTTTSEEEKQGDELGNVNNHESINKSKNQKQLKNQEVDIERNINDNKKANESESKDRLSINQDLANDNQNMDEDQQNQSNAIQELETEQSNDVNEEEEEEQANVSQETEAEKSEEENEDHTASLIYDDSESENESETNKTVEDNESQEDNNKSNKNEEDTSKHANVSEDIENTDNKSQEISSSKKDVGANVSQKLDKSQKVQNKSIKENNETVGDEKGQGDRGNVSHKADKSQEVENEPEEENDEAMDDNSGEVAEANISNKVDESQEVEHESEGENDEAMGDDNEANVSHKIDEIQEVDNESEEENDEVVDDDNDEVDEANVSNKLDESQEVEHESEDEKSNISVEIENTDNKSQENSDGDNEEDDEANVDESQEKDQESEEDNDDNEMNNSANECLEQSNNESEQSENENDVDANTSEQEEMEVDEIESNEVSSEEVIDESPDVTHDTTGRNRKKVKSPEVILHDKTNLQNSFTANGRNTSVRKSKSLYKGLNIRPSLAPPRDSLGISERDSSAEGSGWDSHRTTRKTLRQTFGKDFTPRKSLRALVMEKSAKRQTEHMETLHSVTAKFPQANSTEYPEDSNREEIPVESDHEVSRNTRLTTLEAYLEKIKQKNQENKYKMDEAIRNSLKAPSSQEVLNLFKVPTRPPLRKLKPTSDKPKKQTKYTELFGELPPEVIEDMKYKPPKRYQPPNASWVTKRLYKFLESKLEPNYDYKARVRAEKLVETIYAFAKEVLRHKHSVAPPDAVDVLKHELARLNVVKTHFEFYEFFHEFMPRELRVKVVPDVVNKIPLPRHGVFADILRGTTVQG